MGEVINWLNSLLATTTVSVVTKQYALLSLAKLSTRFKTVTQDILNSIDIFGSNHDIDLQQRSVEMGKLFRSQAMLRSKLLEPMPPMEKHNLSSPTNPTASANNNNVVVNGSDNTGLLADLGGGATLVDVDLIGGLGQPTPSLPQSCNEVGLSSLEDIMGLSLGGGEVGQTPSFNLLDSLGGDGLGTPAAPSLGITGGGLDSLLNGVDTLSFATSSTPPFTVYEKYGLRINFTFPNKQGATLDIVLQAQNLTQQTISDFNFQAAVPKSMQLQMQASDSNAIPASASVSQQMTVTNPSQAQLRMKLKISFSSGGVPVSDMAEVNNFPL